MACVYGGVALMPSSQHNCNTCCCGTGTGTCNTRCALQASYVSDVRQAFPMSQCQTIGRRQSSQHGVETSTTHLTASIQAHTAIHPSRSFTSTHTAIPADIYPHTVQRYPYMKPIHPSIRPSISLQKSTHTAAAQRIVVTALCTIFDIIRFSLAGGLAMTSNLRAQAEALARARAEALARTLADALADALAHAPAHALAQALELCGCSYQLSRH